MPTFESALEAIPSALLDRSGKVFYSGREAFIDPAPIYILGANPGGAPELHADETLRMHTQWVEQEAPFNWSAYRDESWKHKAPGRHGMQPRILHTLKRLGLNPGAVPASNLVFVRSSRESTLDGNFRLLADQCWSFHQHIIQSQRPKAILCLGGTAGDYVLHRLGQHRLTSTFTEANARRWQSHCYAIHGGPCVIVATHPSIADWTKEATDPTTLIEAALNGD
jgi:hypothetical protein